MAGDFDHFRTRLTIERQLRGWSQAHLATQLGVNPSAVSQWELGHRRPTAANAHRWAATLNVPLPDATDGWFSRLDRMKQPVHGTRNGYQWHQRNNDLPACGPCRDAGARYTAGRKAARLQREAAEPPQIQGSAASHRGGAS
jgi:transcriptional regulator with XRE-family HTH domain